MAKDYYVALRVERDATPEQIQAAYKHWAKELQPSQDSAPGQDVQELQQAYTVLGHPERRRAYDRAQEAEPLHAPRHTEKMSARPQEVSLRESFDTYQPSFDELFDRFWSNFDSMSRPKAEGLESLTVDVPITPEQARTGGRARILIPARAQCPACLGRGAVGYYQCWHCGGQGSITADYPLELTYPAGLMNEHVVQVPLEQFGIRNFYLTVRFRVSGFTQAGGPVTGSTG